MLLWLLLLPLVMASSSHQSSRGKDGQEVAADILKRSCQHVRLHNLTVFGQKAWSYLDAMAEDERPDIIAATETHLI